VFFSRSECPGLCYGFLAVGPDSIRLAFPRQFYRRDAFTAAMLTRRGKAAVRPVIAQLGHANLLWTYRNGCGARCHQTRLFLRFGALRTEFNAGPGLPPSSTGSSSSRETSRDHCPGAGQRPGAAPARVRGAPARLSPPASLTWLLATPTFITSS
jgi:hypothetical protein